jgi:hypothetical protein
MGKRTPTRSPLSDRPLRLPGQSVQEEIDRVVDDALVGPILFAAGFTGLALAGWIQVLSGKPPNPWLLSLVAAISLAYAAISIVRARKRLSSLRLARDGERIVAEQLDALKQEGAGVLHNIPADGFNIDHVIISTKGVFVAETKTRSKRIRSSPTVKYDGKLILADGIPPDRDPIAQVEANARWIASTLKSSTGKSFPVKGVILFPGWFVEPLPPNAKIWVLEPKALPAFIRNEPVRIQEEDVHLAVYHMSRIVRAKE